MDLHPQIEKKLPVSVPFNQIGNETGTVCSIQEASGTGRKKTENHSLTFSTSTRQGGPQFAKSILAAALSIQYLIK